MVTEFLRKTRFEVLFDHFDNNTNYIEIKNVLKNNCFKVDINTENNIVSLQFYDTEDLKVRNSIAKYFSILPTTLTVVAYDSKGITVDNIKVSARALEFCDNKYYSFDWSCEANKSYRTQTIILKDIEIRVNETNTNKIKVNDV